MNTENISQKTIILINPFPSGRYLAEQLKGAGIYTVAIFTHPYEEIGLAFRPADDSFNEQVYFNNPTVNEITERIKHYNIVYIVNGQELATELTDKLNELFLPNLANDSKTSNLRNNKYDMHQKLKDVGLAFISQNIIDIKNITSDVISQIQFPCFCKPLFSAGSLGAFRADNKEQLLQKSHELDLQKLFYQLKIYDTANLEKYIIAEYVEGEEMFVDTFSVNGIHYVSSVQKYTKQILNGNQIHRSVEVVTDNRTWDTAANYVKQCLDAVGMDNGFAHTELFLTKQGPKLIEINPRISGARGYPNKMAQSIGLKSQTDLLIEFINNGKITESNLKNMNNYSRLLLLCNFSDSPLRDPAHVLHKFESVIQFDLLGKVGYVSNSSTKSILDLDLLVLCINKNKQTLENDISRIFTLEQENRLF